MNMGTYFNWKLKDERLDLKTEFHLQPFSGDIYSISATPTIRTDEKTMSMQSEMPKCFQAWIVYDAITAARLTLGKSEAQRHTRLATCSRAVWQCVCNDWYVMLIRFLHTIHDFC